MPLRSPSAACDHSGRVSDLWHTEHQCCASQISWFLHLHGSLCKCPFQPSQSLMMLSGFYGYRLIDVRSALKYYKYCAQNSELFVPLLSAERTPAAGSCMYESRATYVCVHKHHEEHYLEIRPQEFIVWVRILHYGGWWWGGGVVLLSVHHMNSESYLVF